MADGPSQTFIDAAVQWRREQRKQHEQERPNGPDEREEWFEPLPYFTLASLAGLPVPERRFVDSAEMLPAKNVVLLSGEGAAGKSLLALQLTIACTTATRWIGINVQPGPVVYLSAEDDRDECHRRAADICKAEGIPMTEAMTACIIVLTGEDAVLAAENKQGRLTPQTALKRLAMLCEEIEPELLILDNLAVVFAGNENNRALAQQFVSMLRGLAIRHDCTVLLLGHPSLSGISLGTGTSGSTAWNNSVRSRLYLTKPEGALPNDPRRILQTMKANYSALGQSINLKWVNGRLMRTEPKTAIDRITAEDTVRVAEAFSAHAYRHSVQATDWGGYKVAELLTFDIGRGIDKKHLSQEQLQNIADVKTLLNAWCQAKKLFVIDGVANGERVPIYSTVEPKEEEENNDDD